MCALCKFPHSIGKPSILQPFAELETHPPEGPTATQEVVPPLQPFGFLLSFAAPSHSSHTLLGINDPKIVWRTRPASGRLLFIGLFGSIHVCCISISCLLRMRNHIYKRTMQVRDVVPVSLHVSIDKWLPSGSCPPV